MKKIKQQLLKSRFTKIVAIVAITLGYSSCSDFLDIVPDNVATLENAWDDTNQAEKYLFTCYSYRPNETDNNQNTAMLAGDEFWFDEIEAPPVGLDVWWNVARGYQRAGDPFPNYWDGNRAKDLFAALRDCNIFLENVSNLNKVQDLDPAMRKRWIAEVTFLKAYYHFYLLRLYGPIPLVDKNLPVTATPDQLHVKRVPFDDCVNYIVGLLDECYENLPLAVTSVSSELGRITKPINLAVKAQVLLLAASPLFNPTEGDNQYANFKNKDGQALINQSFDITKWQRAADATKAAIDLVESPELTYPASLYQYPLEGIVISDETRTQMSIRHAFAAADRNTEAIWVSTNSMMDGQQNFCLPILDPEWSPETCKAAMAPPLKIVKDLFYTKNGVPVSEDATLDFNDWTALRTGVEAEKYNIGVGYQTARINFDREPRFYADLGFDGSKWFKTGDASDNNSYVLRAKKGQIGWGSVLGHKSATGYFLKKWVNFNTTAKNNGQFVKRYAKPTIRLAELYLSYAEALNEAQGPVEDVHTYINLVRARAGLGTVTDSWRDFSVNPNKPATKAGMRDIIRHERLIELAFEGHRYHDLRRWKTAQQVLNAPITGWTIGQKEAAGYYQVRTLYQQNFNPRDYLWPIALGEMGVNKNLVQNPGW